MPALVWERLGRYYIRAGEYTVSGAGESEEGGAARYLAWYGRTAGGKVATCIGVAETAMEAREICELHARRAAGPKS